MGNRNGKHRWQKRFEVLMRLDGERIKGYLSNLSNEGMEIHSRARMQINDELGVRIITPDGKRFNYLSEIRWWRPAIGRKMGKGIYRYGLRHMAVDPDHSSLIELVKYDPQRRKIPRIDAELKVEITSQPEFSEGFTENISIDGAFLRIDDCPPPYKDENVTLGISIPGMEVPIVAEAKVVHILQPSWATKIGLPPGLGLHFMNLTDDVREKLDEFLKIQEKQRQENTKVDEAEITLKKEDQQH